MFCWFKRGKCLKHSKDNPIQSPQSLSQTCVLPTLKQVLDDHESPPLISRSSKIISHPSRQYRIFFHPFRLGFTIWFYKSRNPKRLTATAAVGPPPVVIRRVRTVRYMDKLCHLQGSGIMSVTDNIAMSTRATVCFIAVIASIGLGPAVFDHRPVSVFSRACRRGEKGLVRRPSSAPASAPAGPG